MAYWRVGKDVRRAVDSILNQTHGDVQLVVVNDGDFDDPPWPYLNDIEDPRLVRFDLAENHGRFFVDQVIFEATRPSWWALQDPDDQALPQRFEVMLELAQNTGMAIAPRREFRNGTSQLVATNLNMEPRPRRMRHIIGYGSAVIDGWRIEQVGGFHAGVRVAYDTYLMNACMLLGPTARYSRPLQYKYRDNPDSLTQSKQTGLASPYRRSVRKRLDSLWAQTWERHHRREEIASHLRDDIPPDVRDEASMYADKLRCVL